MFAGIYLIFSWYAGKSYVFQIKKTEKYSPFQRKSTGNLAFISLDTMFKWMESSWHWWHLENGCSCPTFSWSFQDISPLLGSDGDGNDTRGSSDKVNVPVEVKGFINLIVDDDVDEDNDEFYACEEGGDDVEFRWNAFDVIIDDEE